MIEGCLHTIYKKCGNPDCHCATGKKHGSYLAIASKRGGRSKLTYVSDREVIKKASLYKKYNKDMARLRKINEKRYRFYDKKKKAKAHDREVLSNYAGELLQHDSSHHRWSPYTDAKWHLITTLDDYSRKILYGDFLESESSWSHIEAAEYVCQKTAYLSPTMSTVIPYSDSCRKGTLSGGII